MNTGSEEMYPFPIVKKGYDPEAVDSYIEELLEQNRFLNSRNADLERRLAETQELISRYTKAEDTLRQNIADSKRAAAAMIVEARQRSSALLEDARNECGKIIADMDAEVADRMRTMETIKTQVTQFKDQLFQLYSGHIELIDAVSRTAEEFTYEPNYTPVAETVDAFEAQGELESEAPVFEEYPEESVFLTKEGVEEKDNPQTIENTVVEEVAESAPAQSAEEFADDDFFLAPEAGESADYLQFLDDFANGDTE